MAAKAPAKPKDDRKTVSFKVTPEDYDKLKEAAAGDGLSFSAWCREQLGGQGRQAKQAP